MVDRLLRLLEYLFLPPGPVGVVYRQYAGYVLAVYLTLLVAIMFFYLVARALNGRHALKNWLVNRMLVIGGVVTLLGVLLLLVRPLNWPILSTRMLLASQAVALLLLTGYLWWWLQFRYPAALAAYEWEERKKLYLPRTAAGATARPRRKRELRRR